MSGFQSQLSRPSALSHRAFVARPPSVARFALPLLSVAAFALIAVGVLLNGLSPQAFASAQVATFVNIVSGQSPDAAEILAVPADPAADEPRTVAQGDLAVIGTGVPYAAIGAVLIASAVSVMAVVARRREEGGSN